MPRNGSGSYSLPEAAFVPNTPISSADVNSDFDDIADALTDSLSRTGDGGMQAVLELDNTGFTYSSDPNTGMRRTAGDEQAIECGGVDVIEITSTGATVNGDLEVTGTITSGGDPILLIGEIKIWTSATIPAKWLLMDGSSLLRASYPDLWTFAAAEIAAGNTLFTNGNGSTTFTIGTMAGYAPVGVDTTGATLGSVTHVGDTTGSKSVTLAADQIPAGVPSSGNNSISVTSTISNILRSSTHDNYTSVAGDAGFIQNVTNGSVTSTNASQAISVTSTNASQQVTPIVQPSRAFKFIIYAGA